MRKQIMFITQIKTDLYIVDDEFMQMLRDDKFEEIKQFQQFISLLLSVFENDLKCYLQITRQDKTEEKSNGE